MTELNQGRGGRGGQGQGGWQGRGHGRGGGRSYSGGPSDRNHTDGSRGAMHRARHNTSADFQGQHMQKHGAFPGPQHGVPAGFPQGMITNQNGQMFPGHTNPAAIAFAGNQQPFAPPMPSTHLDYNQQAQISGYGLPSSISAHDQHVWNQSMQYQPQAPRPPPGAPPPGAPPPVPPPQPNMYQRPPAPVQPYQQPPPPAAPPPQPRPPPGPPPTAVSYAQPAPPPTYPPVAPPPVHPMAQQYGVDPAYGSLMHAQGAGVPDYAAAYASVAGQQVPTPADIQAWASQQMIDAQAQQAMQASLPYGLPVGLGLTTDSQPAPPPPPPPPGATHHQDATQQQGAPAAPPPSQAPAPPSQTASVSAAITAPQPAPPQPPLSSPPLPSGNDTGDATKAGADQQSLTKAVKSVKAGRPIAIKSAGFFGVHTAQGGTTGTSSPMKGDSKAGDAQHELTPLEEFKGQQDKVQAPDAEHKADVAPPSTAGQTVTGSTAADASGTAGDVAPGRRRRGSMWDAVEPRTSQSGTTATESAIQVPGGVQQAQAQPQPAPPAVVVAAAAVPLPPISDLVPKGKCEPTAVEAGIADAAAKAAAFLAKQFAAQATTTQQLQPANLVKGEQKGDRDEEKPPRRHRSRSRSRSRRHSRGRSSSRSTDSSSSSSRSRSRSRSRRRSRSRSRGRTRSSDRNRKRDRSDSRRRVRGSRSKSVEGRDRRQGVSSRSRSRGRSSPGRDNRSRHDGSSRGRDDRPQHYGRHEDRRDMERPIPRLSPSRHLPRHRHHREDGPLSPTEHRLPSSSPSRYQSRRSPALRRHDAREGGQHHADRRDGPSRPPHSNMTPHEEADGHLSPSAYVSAGHGGGGADGGGSSLRSLRYSEPRSLNADSLKISFPHIHPPPSPPPDGMTFDMDDVAPPPPFPPPVSNEVPPPPTQVPDYTDEEVQSVEDKVWSYFSGRLHQVYCPDRAATDGPLDNDAVVEQLTRMFATVVSEWTGCEEKGFAPDPQDAPAVVWDERNLDPADDDDIKVRHRGTSPGGRELTDETPDIPWHITRDRQRNIRDPRRSRITNKGPSPPRLAPASPPAPGKLALPALCKTEPSPELTPDQIALLQSWREQKERPAKDVETAEKLPEPADNAAPALPPPQEDKEVVQAPPPPPPVQEDQDVDMAVVSGSQEPPPVETEEVVPKEALPEVQVYTGPNLVRMVAKAKREEMLEFRPGPSEWKAIDFVGGKVQERDTSYSLQLLRMPGRVKSGEIHNRMLFRRTTDSVIIPYSMVGSLQTKDQLYWEGGEMTPPREVLPAQQHQLDHVVAPSAPGNTTPLASLQRLPSQATPEHVDGSEGQQQQQQPVTAEDVMLVVQEKLKHVDVDATLAANCQKALPSGPDDIAAWLATQRNKSHDSAVILLPHSARHAAAKESFAADVSQTNDKVKSVISQISSMNGVLNTRLAANPLSSLLDRVRPAVFAAGVITSQASMDILERSQAANALSKGVKRARHGGLIEAGAGQPAAKHAKHDPAGPQQVDSTARIWGPPPPHHHVAAVGLKLAQDVAERTKQLTRQVIQEEFDAWVAAMLAPPPPPAPTTKTTARHTTGAVNTTTDGTEHHGGAHAATSEIQQQHSPQGAGGQYHHHEHDDHKDVCKEAPVLVETPQEIRAIQDPYAAAMRYSTPAHEGTDGETLPVGHKPQPDTPQRTPAAAAAAEAAAVISNAEGDDRGAAVHERNDAAAVGSDSMDIDTSSPPQHVAQDQDVAQENKDNIDNHDKQCKVEDAVQDEDVVQDQDKQGMDIQQELQPQPQEEVETAAEEDSHQNLILPVTPPHAEEQEQAQEGHQEAEQMHDVETSNKVDDESMQLSLPVTPPHLPAAADGDDTVTTRNPEEGQQSTQQDAQQQQHEQQGQQATQHYSRPIEQLTSAEEPDTCAVPTVQDEATHHDQPTTISNNDVDDGHLDVVPKETNVVPMENHVVPKETYVNSEQARASPPPPPPPPPVPGVPEHKEAPEDAAAPATEAAIPVCEPLAGATDTKDGVEDAAVQDAQETALPPPPADVAHAKKHLKFRLFHKLSAQQQTQAVVQPEPRYLDVEQDDLAEGMDIYEKKTKSRASRTTSHKLGDHAKHADHDDRHERKRSTSVPDEDHEMHAERSKPRGKSSTPEPEDPQHPHPVSRSSRGGRRGGSRKPPVRPGQRKAQHGSDAEDDHDHDEIHAEQEEQEPESGKPPLGPSLLGRRRSRKPPKREASPDGEHGDDVHGDDVHEEGQDDEDAGAHGQGRAVPTTSAPAKSPFATAATTAPGGADDMEVDQAGQTHDHAGSRGMKNEAQPHRQAGHQDDDDGKQEEAEEEDEDSVDNMIIVRTRRPARAASAGVAAATAAAAAVAKDHNPTEAVSPTGVASGRGRGGRGSRGRSGAPPVHRAGRGRGRGGGRGRGRGRGQGDAGDDEHVDGEQPMDHDDPMDIDEDPAQHAQQGRRRRGTKEVHDDAHGAGREEDADFDAADILRSLSSMGGAAGAVDGSDGGAAHDDAALPSAPSQIQDDEEQLEQEKALVFKEKLSNVVKAFRRNHRFKNQLDMPAVEAYPEMAERYLSVISRPMDLSTLDSMVNEGTYPPTAEGCRQFLQDLRLVGDNVRTYQLSLDDDERDPVFMKIAEHFHKLFEEKAQLWSQIIEPAISALVQKRLTSAAAGAGRPLKRSR